MAQRLSAFVLAVVFSAVPVTAQICDARCAQHAGDPVAHEGLAAHHHHTSDHHNSSDHLNDSEHRNDSDHHDSSDRHDGSSHYDRPDHSERPDHHDRSEHHDWSDDHHGSDHQHTDREHSDDHHHASPNACVQPHTTASECREVFRKAVAGRVTATVSVPTNLMSQQPRSDAIAVIAASVLARSISQLRI